MAATDLTADLIPQVVRQPELADVGAAQPPVTRLDVRQDVPAARSAAQFAFTPLPTGPFDLLLADPPWAYYGSPTKHATAGKHYRCLTAAELGTLPVRDLLAPRSLLFCWSPGPQLPAALEVMTAWGFHFRGVAFVWVKTARDGHIIAGQGIRPTTTKPTSEYVLCGTTTKRGRPLPIHDEAMGRLLAPRGAHSAKPPQIRPNIERLYGEKVRKLELFARQTHPGWTGWGDELEDSIRR